MADLEDPTHPQRDQTDESLRVERDRADARDAEKRDAVELAADEVLRVARERADEVVQTARDDADRRQPPRSESTLASSERQRNRADIVLDAERSTADAAVDRERAERRRYLADFLAVEREATDEDLTGERAHADTAIEARDAVLAIVSHDLRGLLNGLSLNADVLKGNAPEGVVGDEIRRYAAMNKRLVARMNRLVGDLLDVASIDAGKLGFVPGRIDLIELQRDTLHAFESIAAAKRITLATENNDGEQLPSSAWGDSDRILQVLANLVSNAIKFTPAMGRVSIRIRNETTEVQFTVSDTGVGIPNDALLTVFERFRQVRPDRRGLGLGLHISKCIVEAHGGRMWAESELNAGSSFHFTLPAAAPSGSHPEPPSSKA